MSFPTGLVRYYTCTQLEYNRLLADNRIIDNALYYIRNWQAAEGNLSAISNDVTHVYLGKQLIGGAYRYPSGSVLLGGDPNSTRIGSDSWGTNNIFSATNNPNGYDNVILLGTDNIATSGNQILLGDRVSWQGKNSQGKDVTPVPLNTFFAVGKDGRRYIEVTNKANLLMGSVSLPLPTVHNYGAGCVEGNIILPDNLHPTGQITFEDTCVGNVIVAGSSSTIKSSGTNFISAPNSTLDNVGYSLLLGANNRIRNAHNLLALTNHSELSGFGYSIVIGEGHKAHGYLSGQFIAGSYADVTSQTLVAIGGGSSTQFKNVFDLDVLGNGQISGLGSWRTHNGSTNFISATDNIRIMTDPSHSDPKYLTLESDHIALVGNQNLSINTSSIILTGFSGPVPITGVATPSKEYLYSAANVDYVEKRLTAVIGGAPGALDTLNELAAALGDDENFATTVTNRFTADEKRLSDLEQNKMNWFGDVELIGTNTTAGYSVTVPTFDGLLDGFNYFNISHGRNVLQMTTMNNPTQLSGDLFVLGNSGGITRITSPTVEMSNATTLVLRSSGTQILNVQTSSDNTSAVNLGQLNAGLNKKMDMWGGVTTLNNGTVITPTLPGNLVFQTVDKNSYISLCPGDGGITDIMAGGGIRLGCSGGQIMLLGTTVELESSTGSTLSITGVTTPDGTNTTQATNVEYVQNCLTVTNW